MSVTLTATPLEITYSSGSRTRPLADYIEIDVNLTNGKFLPQPNDYTLTVFYGIPPNYQDYPVTNYYLYTSKLSFIGAINSIYSVAQAVTTESVIEGEITVPEPLPFDVYINVAGLPTTFTLEAGQTRVAFSFSTAHDLDNEAVKESVNTKMAELNIAPLVH